MLSSNPTDSTLCCDAHTKWLLLVETTHNAQTVKDRISRTITVPFKCNWLPIYSKVLKRQLALVVVQSLRC